ncbi:hypothetical protein L596_000679 [Steinernema carpocapsae]|uniref:Uncharacterized protein n=1 Tax=Steinernema carpocapsae TaxID=34508 RepID=A0A4U8UL68_STECR|nr:hypothetical protein L596_000679 [Steinernema carpocapsae]
MTWEEDSRCGTLSIALSASERTEAIVNYDRTCAVFLKMRIPIIDYFLSVVSRRPRLTDADYRGLENFHWSPDQIAALRESLKGLTMVTTYGGTSYYLYKFLDVYRDNASETMFNWRRPEDNEEVSRNTIGRSLNKWHPTPTALSSDSSRSPAEEHLFADGASDDIRPSAVPGIKQ